MASTLDRPHLYKELEALINQNDHNETKCGKYLLFTPNILFKKDMIVDPNRIRCVSAYPGSLGISDYIFATQVYSDGGYKCMRAYIWELKAPQCFIFREDERTDKRVLPSIELITAESQLLHYYHELKNSHILREDLGEINPREIKIGGIIIGSNRTKVFKGKKLKKLENVLIEGLYTRAYRIRADELYSCCQLRLLNWDTVLLQLRDLRIGETHTGDAGTSFEPPGLPEGPIESGPA